MLTKVGPDGFGDFVRQKLTSFGVDVSFVGTSPDLLTPIVFCELDPPEDPPLLFYRLPVAPDLTLAEDDVPWDLVRDVPLLWVTGTGVSVEPARATQHALLQHRERRQHTVLDLDWRPMFWSSASDARRELARMLPLVTVVVGNLSEVEVAVGSRNPELAATRLREAGVDVVVVKMGAEGVLVATDDGIHTIAPQRITVVNGLGAGDAFGAALAHGLLAGWDAPTIGAYANAAGAIVASHLACSDAMPTLQDLENFMSRSPV